MAKEMRTRTSPADAHNVESVDSKLIQRQDVESTLNRRCFDVMCLLGPDGKTDLGCKPIIESLFVLIIAQYKVYVQENMGLR